LFDSILLATSGTKIN